MADDPNQHPPEPKPEEKPKEKPDEENSKSSIPSEPSTPSETPTETLSETPPVPETPPPVEEYRKKLERDILAIIEEKLKNGQMDAERAKGIARLVLDKLHPPLTLEQIYQIAPTLDDHFAELAAAVLPVMQEHNEKVRTIVTQHAQKLIKLGKIDEASQVLKQAIQRESKIN